MPQQVTTGPAPMKGVERMNVVVVRGSEAGVGQNMGVPPRQNPYAMEVDCVVATTRHLRTNDLTMSKAL